MPVTAAEPSWTQLIRDHGLRVTGPRLAVMRIPWRQSHLGAEQIVRAAAEAEHLSLRSTHDVIFERWRDDCRAASAPHSWSDFASEPSPDVPASSPSPRPVSDLSIASTRRRR